MPGTILEIKVNVGDKVSADDTVFVLEAMKMENDITADADGTVKEILFNKGETVPAGATVIVLE